MLGSPGALDSVNLSRALKVGAFGAFRFLALHGALLFVAIRPDIFGGGIKLFGYRTLDSLRPSKPLRHKAYRGRSFTQFASDVAEAGSGQPQACPDHLVAKFIVHPCTYTVSVSDQHI